MEYTEDMLVKDLQALQEVIDALNDLVCLVTRSGVSVTLRTETDAQGRPQIKMFVEE